MNAQGNVLLTGANGYLGRHLLHALKDADRPAVALVRRLSDWKKLNWLSGLGGDVTPLEGSPLEPLAWQSEPTLSNTRTLFHAAAVVRHSRENADEVVHFNVQSTLQMVRLAKELGARLVFISSSGTVGCSPFPDVVADEYAPFAQSVVGQWPYYLSKIRAEREGRQLADKLGVEWVVVRLPVLLGPGDHRFRSVGYVLKALKGQLPGIPRGGMHFADIRDVAKALVKLASLERPRDIYHLPGTQSSLRAFFQMVSEVSGVSMPERDIPPWLLNGVARATRLTGPLGRRHLPWLPDPVLAEMSAHHWGLSTLFSHKELDYGSRSPRQTLVDTVAWLRENHPDLGALRAA